MESLETGLRAALLRDGCRILEALLNQPGALGAVQPAGQLHEVRSRQVRSLLGTFELQREYYQQGTERAIPMDTFLGLTDSYTPFIQQFLFIGSGLV